MTDDRSKMDWYRRNPAKFIGGTVGMTFDVKGAYSILLDLIYDGQGSCPDDGPWIVNILGVGMSVRRWNVIKAELVARGKITVENGRIFNPAATRELAKIETKVGQSPGKDPGKNRDKSTDKTAEKQPELFDNKDLTPTRPSKSATVPARAPESQSLEGQSREDVKTVGKVIEEVEAIATILRQQRGRYWEQDYRRMLDQDELTFGDVLEAAKAHRGDPIKSMRALSGLARKKRDDRVAGLREDATAPADVTAPALTDADWREHLERLLRRGIWPVTMVGAAPGLPGSAVPPDHAEVFLALWRAQGSHPPEELDRNGHFVRYPADNPDDMLRSRWPK